MKARFLALLFAVALPGRMRKWARTRLAIAIMVQDFPLSKKMIDGK